MGAKTTARTRPNFKMFKLYTIDELAKRPPAPNGLGYGDQYLLMIRDGYRKPSERFMDTACGILNRTREELFGNTGG